VLARYGIAVEQIARTPRSIAGCRACIHVDRVARPLPRSIVRQTVVVLTYGFAWGVVNWASSHSCRRFCAAAASTRVVRLSALSLVGGGDSATALVAWAYGRWSSRKSMVVFAGASVVATLGLAWFSPRQARIV
jgi:hypothetical protein